jgi:hypothetical protein
MEHRQFNDVTRNAVRCQEDDCPSLLFVTVGIGTAGYLLSVTIGSSRLEQHAARAAGAGLWSDLAVRRG